MSHIDSFKHEQVGQFGCLPVYHPLQKIDGDFQCNESQLVLGGGSGEHPALVIKNPLAAVAWFLEEELDQLDKENIHVREYPLKQYIQEWRDIIKKHLKWEYDENLQFYEWSITTYKDFYEICTSPAMPNPYNEESDRSFESWLILGFGEFIYFAMPELVSEIVEKLENPYQYFNHMQFNNILVIPKNMPVYAVGGNAFKFK